jgi:hypothetical protein
MAATSSPGAMDSFNSTARVMRYLAQNTVHVNGAVSWE